MMTVSRRKTLRALAASVSLSFAGASGCVEAAAQVTTVYPTGSFPLDVHNVQAAVDGGGTVVLKASNVSGDPTAFNFGTPYYLVGSGINIYNDVEIVGERVAGKMTTISGGFLPVIGVAAARTRIADIDFESPGGSAIVITASTGTEITGNIVNSVVPDLLGVGFTETDGIDLFGNYAPGVTGKALISGNLIEGLAGDFANGMQLDEVAANVTISDNVVIFEQSNGYIQTLGIAAFRSHGKVSISRNYVYMGPGNANAYPAPVFVGGEHEAIYTISNNNIVSNHPNADGIEVDGGDFSEPTNGANVSGNRILISSTYPGLGGAGVSFYGGVNNAIVSGNIIEGSSAFALQIAEGFFGGANATSNRVVGNDISGHADLTSDIYLGSNSNHTVVAGRCASAIDLGIANRVNCGGNIHAAPISRGAVRALRARTLSMPGLHRELLDHALQRPTR